MYDLTFFEAITKCMNNEGFIKGEQFGKGIYVKNKENQLVLVSGAHLHTEVGPLPITKQLLEQKYKVFSVANPNAIG